MKQKPQFTYEYSNTWEEIRANWVNGNLTEAKELLYQLPKRRILKVIGLALNAHAQNCSNDGTRSGDLQDLREILTALNGN